MRVYYMTSAHWGAVILKTRRLKLSRFFESNDPFELKLVDSRKREQRQMVKTISEHLNSTYAMEGGARRARPKISSRFSALVKR